MKIDNNNNNYSCCCCYIKENNNNKKSNNYCIYIFIVTALRKSKHSRPKYVRESRKKPYWGSTLSKVTNLYTKH